MTAGPVSRLRVWVATDIGKVRRENEDCVGAGDTILQSPTGRFNLELPFGEAADAVIVADGVGGGCGGKVAASLAVETFLGRRVDVADIGSLARLIDGVSESIRLFCTQNSATRGGATTLAGLLFSRTFALAFNIGDSRVYRICSGELELLSQDHVSSSDARTLTRFLGGSGVMATPYCREIDFLPGNRYLVCSDGLYGVVANDQLLQLARISDGALAVEALIATALEAGAPDNVTIALCDPV
ncbi:MAG: protein phosphatase 2C domain-containing protein [Magnetococcales bacterium]|nr:protein phosphatase 2C domain-containing protein [Magnetococcales bacterium]